MERGCWTGSDSTRIYGMPSVSYFASVSQSKLREMSCPIGRIG